MPKLPLIGRQFQKENVGTFLSYRGITSEARDIAHTDMANSYMLAMKIAFSQVGFHMMDRNYGVIGTLLLYQDWMLLSITRHHA